MAEFVSTPNAEAGEYGREGNVRAINAPATEQQSAQWWDLVARYRAAAQDFEQRWRQLQADAEFARARPALRAEYDRVMARANEVRASVVQMVAKLETAVDWIKGAVGLSALGVLPIVSVAAIAVALALVTNTVADMVAMGRRIAEQRRLEAGGMSPEDASKTVSTIFGDSEAISKALPILIPLALAGLAWWLISKRGGRG